MKVMSAPVTIISFCTYYGRNHSEDFQECRTLIFIAHVFWSMIADEEHVFLDLDVKLAKYAPPKWKDEVI